MNMKCLEKYTGEKTYMYPNGVLATPQRVLEDFPAALTFAWVVETDHRGEVMLGMYNLSALEDQYNIDPALTDEEAIEAIENIMNAPEPEPTPNAQTAALEDIAAQLEYQNMMSLEDVESEV